MQLKFLTYNILHGGAGREDLILRVLQAAKADVVLLQEIVELDTVMTFANALNMQTAVAGDLAVLSCHPIVAKQQHHSFPPIQDTVLDVTLEYKPAAHLHVVGVHPIAYPGSFLEVWRDRQLGIARSEARCHSAEACILAGDLNSIAPNDKVLTDSAPLIVKLLYWLQRGKIYRSAITGILTDGYTDCFRRLHPDSDGFTIPTPSPKVRLDYVFVNAIMRPALRACEVVTQPPDVHRASDHYPVVAEFEL